ncbi:MAG: type IV pilus assembly protein FimV [Gammaproteobacteria bacterium]
MENEPAECTPTEAEICFHIPESGELHLDLGNREASALEYLKYCVLRNPADLLSHLRRIMLVDDSGDSEELYAALIDLFIALGSKGESLRSRLLRRYRTKLGNTRYPVLAQFLKHGANGRNVFSCLSVLSKGVSGTCSLIQRMSDESAPDKSRDPLQEAREYLEYSQIDQARLILERAVLEYPQRIDYQQELLQLYRAVRDSKNFKKIHNQLKSSGKPLSDDWNAISKFLAESA